MPNEETHKLALSAMMRSPEKTWVALGHLREGRIEEGLQLLHDLADGITPIDWAQVDVDWLVMAAHCMTSAEGAPKGNVPRHETWQ